ncbi:pyridoxal kinase-like protein [Sarcoptes scabiei]|uniref:Pyridoxal kinase n=1 Tax=Sarcoptes scabiei TaxID=52283 RepID=A0A132A835_SARSC|nr:pyridoxal kinase-like protein [Sarcoptes scabiei]
MDSTRPIEIPRVLSIQSHVVSGYCGNKSAVFPLQLLGFEVDFINSVQFSNHTGYPFFKGQILEDLELEQLFDGLRLNNLQNQYSHLLTGYARSPSFLRIVKTIVQEIKQSPEKPTYLCDPVLGDDHKLYVPEELIGIYKEIIPMADIICLNAFEAELLSGVPVCDESSALSAIEKLHRLGPKTVIITSIDIPEHRLMLIGSSYSKYPSNQEKAEIYKFELPKIEARFTGTGDLFASLFLAWFTKTNFNLRIALERVISSMQSIINSTYEFALLKPQGLDSAFNRELRIISCRDRISEPLAIERFESIKVLK